MARLRELGWVEGRTVAIEYRWSEGRPERYTEIAAEFVRLKVDVILTTADWSYLADMSVIRANYERHPDDRMDYQMQFGWDNIEFWYPKPK